MGTITDIEPRTASFIAKAVALLHRVEELDAEGWLMDDKVRAAAADFRQTVESLDSLAA